MKWNTLIAAAGLFIMINACNNASTNKKEEKDTTVVPEYNGDTKVPVDTSITRDSITRDSLLR